MQAGWIEKGGEWYDKLQQAIDRTIDSAAQERVAAAVKPAAGALGVPLLAGLAVIVVVLIAGGCFVLAKIVANIQNLPLVPKPTITVVTNGEMAPSVPAGVLFQDNFGTGLGSAWEIMQGDWRAVDGKLTTITRNGKWSTAYVGDTGWTDYAVELDADLRPRMWDPMELYIRAQDDQNKVGLHLEKAGDYPQLVSIRDGQSVILGKAQDYIPDQVQIRLEAKGDVFTAYINGKRYVSAHEPAFSKGKPGIALFCKGDSACNTIANFKVMSLVQ